MKATGIVRRIDELGRIVIPKEIRRTLRIREGDPLEIYTDREGGIILRKYSPIGELAAFAHDFAESLVQTFGHTVIVCDRDTILAASGESKRDYAERPVSGALEDAMNTRKTQKNTDAESIIPLVSGENQALTTAQVIAPITMDGQPIGAIAIVVRGGTIGEAEQKAAEAAAGFLGRQMAQ